MIALYYGDGMNTYVHVWLGAKDRTVLERLKRSTGRTESEILRRGLHLLAKEEAGRPERRAFQEGPRDISTDRKHLDRFGM